MTKMTTIDPEGCSSSDINGETAIICTYCGKVFNDMVRLKVHQKHHNHQIPSEIMPTDKSSEKKNISVVDILSEGNTYSCIECGKEFSSNLVFQIHNRTHAALAKLREGKGKKPVKKKRVKKVVTKDHECSVCGQLFEKKSYLLLHMRLHTGERPYKCSVCDKTFRLIGHITTHMTTHLKERPFECSVCDKKFARGDYMRKHMKTHTGERPYVCSLCDRAFTLKGNLERHMISHTKEKRYGCAVCGEKFAWEKTMLRHMSKFHSEVKLENNPS